MFENTNCEMCNVNCFTGLRYTICKKCLHNLEFKEYCVSCAKGVKKFDLFDINDCKCGCDGIYRKGPVTGCVNNKRCKECKTMPSSYADLFFKKKNVPPVNEVFWERL